LRRRTGMPARIVVVHDDLEFLNPLTTALRAADYDVAAFDDSMTAWDALGAAQKVELLITRIRFPPGRPHGVALARRALGSRPGVQILFTAAPEMRFHADDLGIFLPTPVSPSEVVDVVNRMLVSDREVTNGPGVHHSSLSDN